MASSLSNVGTLRLDQEIHDEALMAPISKLDADQYSVDDLDGATEGLFGSGSVSYASLQAAQTNELLAAKLAGMDAPGGTGETAGENGDYHYTPIAENEMPRAEVQIAAPQGSNAPPTDTDRALDAGNPQAGEVQAGEGGIGGSSVGAVGASQMASGGGSFIPVDAFSGGNGGGTDGTGTPGGGAVTPAVGTPGASGPAGTSGVSGINGLNGQDGIGGDTYLGDVIQEIDNTFIDLGDEINQVTDILQEVINRAGDIVNNLTDLDLITEVRNTLTEITHNVTTILNDLPLLGDPFSLNLSSLGLAGGHVSGTVQGLLSGDYTGRLEYASPDQLLGFLSDQLADRTGIDALSDALSTLGGVAQHAQTAVDGIADALGGLQNAEDLNDVIGTLGTAVGGIATAVDAAVGDALATIGLGDLAGGFLDPALEMADGILSDPVGAISGILDNPAAAIGDVTGLAADLADGLTSDPMGAVADVADALGGVVGDVADALGLGEIDGGILDPVLDLADGVLADPAGAVGDLLADPAGAVGDLAGGLLGLGGAPEEGDTDLVVDVGIDVAGLGLPGVADEINLDPVEGIVGDIDIDVSAAGEILGGGDDGLLAAADIDMLGLDVLDGDADLPLDASGDLDLGDLPELPGLGAADDGDGGGWTETPIGDGEALFGDVLDGIGGLGDALPDPGGTVAEGLGALPIGIGADHGGGLAGGLFG